jgi:hypothetical protein
MPGRADSDAVKMGKKRTTTRSIMDAALAEYTAEQLKDDKKDGLRIIAEKHHVSYRTLGDLYAGNNNNMDKFNAGKTLLTVAEEEKLIEFILECADRGFPLTNKRVKETALEILHAKHGADWDKLGKNWVRRFLDRHHDRLATHWSSPLDTKRARAVNPTNVKHFYDLLDEIVKREDIPPDNRFGMDETGFRPGCSTTERVVGRRGTNTQHAQEDGERETITVIETIGATGALLTPTVVFRGQNFLSKWHQYNPCKAS